MAGPPGLSVRLVTGTITENRDLCGRAGAPRRTTGSPLESLLTLLSSPVGRLQKEVRLAQKADYSAERMASPLPYDKISVRCPPPSLRRFLSLGQAYVPPTWQGTPQVAAVGPGLSRALPSQLPSLSLQPGDKTLAQSAQMYHYQHQKQQMLSMEK